MKVLTGTQMAEVDRKAINELKIDGLILMENAGIKVFQKIQTIIKNWGTEEDEPFRDVVVISGKGNNGGDGFVIARHLIQNSIPTTVFSITDGFGYSGDALKNFLALENFGDINLITQDTLEDLRDSVLKASIVVDALLGTGIKGPVEGLYADVIEIINESEGIIVSVDIPSGVNADSGCVTNIAVEADYTETLAALKLGLLMYPGANYVGELDVNNIGIPEILIDNNESQIYLTDEEHVFNLLPWRVDDSNKGTYGKVLTIAGSQNMTGAGLLASYSVLKSGAGLSTLASPASLLPFYTGVYPELTYIPLKENSEKTVSTDAVKDLSDKLADYQAIVLGPGMGVNNDTINFTQEILKTLTDKNIPVVIDADALNCISELQSDIDLGENAVITPHPKELSRLLGVELDKILDDRIKYAELAREKYNCVVVLKGSRTLIVSDDSIYINSTGNSGLATGGTGDVLAGVIAGLIAQGLSVSDAAVCGVFIHGMAGDIAAKENTEYSVVATDVINCLSKTYKQLSFL